ncbi:hypothetical protein AB3662_25615 [Sorangium cellulosum]|uniref:hypothetical protein n=1 Tax=Sorangium cellulosum TaxID=56 RepID=UPI003D9A9447
MDPGYHQTSELDNAETSLRMEGERPIALMARGTQVLVDGTPRVTAPDPTGFAVEG